MFCTCITKVAFQNELHGLIHTPTESSPKLLTESSVHTLVFFQRQIVGMNNTVSRSVHDNGMDKYRILLSPDPTPAQLTSMILFIGPDFSKVNCVQQSSCQKMTKTEHSETYRQVQAVDGAQLQGSIQQSDTAT